jgi:hypothetical protein
MIATPDQRNRFLQKLRAKTWVRRKSGSDERNGRNESIRKERRYSGDSVPSPWDFSL